MAAPVVHRWYLEGYFEPDSAVRRVALEQFPAVVGRQAGLPLSGASASMSRYHAELVMRDGRLIVRDLGSKNGTFVNRRRLEHEAALEPGDIVHFADAEFRVCSEELAVSDTDEDTATGAFTTLHLPHHFPAGGAEIARMIEAGAIETVVQPVVELKSGRHAGQECLTRGTWPNLPVAPDELLRVAASVGRAVELSELMRRHSLDRVGEAGLTGPTFVNTHPAELDSPERLLEDLWTARKKWPDLGLVLELHETAVSDIASMQSLHGQLRLIGIALAYDDFGAGRARLMELTAVPPRYLKFDIELVRDIDRAPEQRRRMIELLVRYARDNGIITLAEGIEREAEAETCEALGFDWAQGHYFGKPEKSAVC